jgi:hypothetical protein
MARIWSRGESAIATPQAAAATARYVVTGPPSDRRDGGKEAVSVAEVAALAPVPVERKPEIERARHRPVSLPEVP